MKIDELFNNEALRARFLARIQAELSSTMIANFALDVAGDMLIEEVAARDKRIETLGQEKADLVATNTTNRDIINQLRKDAEKSEGGRRRAS